MYETPEHLKLTARQLLRARSLGERLKPEVFESVLQFGLYAQVRLAGIADEVMTRLDRTADDRSGFVKLLRRMRQLNPALRRPNFLQRLLPTVRRGSGREDLLLDSYDRFCHRLDSMLPQVEAAGRQVGDTLKWFDILFDRNQTYLEELDLHISGARMRLDSLKSVAARLREEHELQTESEEPSDRVRQLERQAERVEQRIADLEASANTARETGPTIRRIQDDLRSLLLEAQDTSLNTATRWKNRFADAVTRARQGDGPAGAPDVVPDAPLVLPAPPTAEAASTAETPGAEEEQTDEPLGLGARLRALSVALKRRRSLRDALKVTDLL